MTRKPGAHAGDRWEEARKVWQVAKAASRRAADEGPATRSWIDSNLFRRFDPIAVGLAGGDDAADNLVCALEMPWPRTLPGL
jgi:hypothetical protein